MSPDKKYLTKKEALKRLTFCAQGVTNLLEEMTSNKTLICHPFYHWDILKDWRISHEVLEFMISTIEDKINSTRKELYQRNKILFRKFSL